MKKALPLTLVLIGAALLITAVVFWIDSSTSVQPESFGKSLRDWITLILGIGASIKGWVDLFKKEKPTLPTTKIDVEGGSPQISTGDHARNIQADTYIENQNVQQPPEPKTPKSLNQLPAPPLDFIGREKELSQLCQNIEKGVVILGIQGMGGIGKTALGLKLAEQIASDYPDGQIYLDLQGAHEQMPLTPEKIMRHVIWSFHPETNFPIDSGELGAMYRSVLNGKKIFIFYDNVRDENQLRPLLPPKSCILFITSRQYFALPGLDAIKLDVLNSIDAVSLVREIAPKVNDKDAETLAKQCDYLPLAIRAAVSVLLSRPDWIPSELIKRLSDNKTRLGLIESSLSLSYTTLDVHLQMYLRQLGAFTTPFGSHAIMSVWNVSNEISADEIIGQLLRTSLLNFDEKRRKYYFHDATILYLNKKFLIDEQSADVLRRYANIYYFYLKEYLDLVMVFKSQVESFDKSSGAYLFKKFQSEKNLSKSKKAAEEVLRTMIVLEDRLDKIQDIGREDIIETGNHFFSAQSVQPPDVWEVTSKVGKGFWFQNQIFIYYLHSLKENLMFNDLSDSQSSSTSEIVPDYVNMLRITKGIKMTIDEIVNKYLAHISHAHRP